MVRVFAAIVNPMYPRSFDEFQLLTSSHFQEVDDLLREESQSVEASIIFFPEYWLHRVNKDFFESRESEETNDLEVIFSGREPVPMGSEETNVMKHLAVQHNFHVSSGWVEKAGSGTYLSALLIEPDGNIPAYQRKLNPTSIERKRWNVKKSRSMKVYEGEHFNLGWLICNDINNPGLAEKLFEKGVHIVHHPKGFDFNDEQFGQFVESWAEVERVRAKDMMAYLVSNTNFLDRGPHEDAPAQIVDYHGIKIRSYHKCGVITAVLDMEGLGSYKERPRENKSHFAAPRVK